jgi:predicted NBD/HSP70 family sugar kinase
MLDIKLRRKPQLDPDFIPAASWNEAFRTEVSQHAEKIPFGLSVQQPDGLTKRITGDIFPHTAEFKELNVKYIERLLKSLLWMQGGCLIYLAAPAELVETLKEIYSDKGARSFDNELIGRKIYDQALQFTACSLEDLPDNCEKAQTIGGHLDGCRIGFDLGGSDRKCAAIVDGEVIYSEEIGWDPYFQKDPDWHIAGIQDSLERAAAKLPRVDAIGGSAAGVYVNNLVKSASLFRGVSEEDFQAKVKSIFPDLQKKWNVPFVVVNDGDVTALSGADSYGKPCMGLSMGTSQAVGYVNGQGRIGGWLNELAFAPVDYRQQAPLDEWSGDRGCGVQYFSQQAVARLAPAAGLDFPDSMPFPERLVEVQKLMEAGDERARAIYLTIGTYLGHSIAFYAEFYDLRNLLILGRVTSGEGGGLILDEARATLLQVYPELSPKVSFHIPNEKNKRHGQAISAASLAPSV